MPRVLTEAIGVFAFAASIGVGCLQVPSDELLNNQISYTLKEAQIIIKS
ncbi:hypothetical protein J2W80_005054 [Methylorubrum extorquens]|nr:hypothetical protein [Methylorubrum extorquens]MCP1587410.1 hypothetical protein [Methylorubrum extorquens]